MARVYVEPHMFSEAWFRPVLDEMRLSKAVSFLFANCEKGLGELQKVRQALEFRKAMHACKKAVEADADQVEKQVEFLDAHSTFSSCKDCDDPHIMAAIFIQPTRYVFSNDHRLARCRTRMNQKIDSRYCAFIVISTDPIYRDHRDDIL